MKTSANLAEKLALALPTGSRRAPSRPTTQMTSWWRSWRGRSTSAHFPKSAHHRRNTFVADFGKSWALANLFFQCRFRSEVPEADFAASEAGTSDRRHWHKHDETDDFFLVLKGTLDIELRDRTVTLNPGEVFVVPKGVEHRPVARGDAHILLIEPTGTPNTGDAATAAPRILA
jgi:mannose-6-phosphate isomerase-like protein (cupin superfamily)